MDKEDIHILRLMGEIERDDSPSQRELSRRLDLSLGLVNTFLKRLVTKGYFKVKTLPRNRIKYFLTPTGLARKSRLTVKYLQYSVNFYKEIKTFLLNKYKEMESNGLDSILFFGAGEVAELAQQYSHFPVPVNIGPGTLVPRAKALDIRRAMEELGYKPKYSIEEGVKHYADWLAERQATS